MKWSRSDREGGDRARATPYGTANGLASPSASRPLRVSAGLRACELEFIPETAPSRASRAQWCMAVSVSLTVAWAAPALHSSLECSPASRFTLKARVWPPGHLRRNGLYARVFSRASRYATCLCLLLTCTSVPAGTHEWGFVKADGNPNRRLDCGALSAYYAVLIVNDALGDSRDACQTQERGPVER
jgi:hypothetical protein